MLTALYAGYTYSKLMPEIKAFTWFLFLSALIDVSATVCWAYRINNMPLLHFYVVAGFVFLYLFYARVFHSMLSPGIMKIMLVLYIAFNIYNSFYLQDIWTFDANGLTAESILILILSLMSFLFLLHDEMRNKYQYSLSSLFWINAGLFIYYSTNLIIFYFGKLFTDSFNVLFNMSTWVIHSFFSMIMYICFFIALWKQQKN